MKQIGFTLLIVLVSSMWTIQAQDFSSRANQAINFHSNNLPKDNNPKWTFWFAQARFVIGDNDGGRSLCNSALDNLDVNDDPAFQLWSAMDCYLRWRDIIDSDNTLKDKFKVKLTNTTGYSSHNTTNKNIMNAAARYLAEQTWGAAVSENYTTEDPTGVNTLNELMEVYTHQGEFEYNTPTYFAFHYGPLRSVADLSDNLSISNQAYLTAEWMLISAAGEWLAGHMVSSAERVSHPRRFKPQNFYDQGNAIQWLYFGGPTPASWKFPDSTPHTYVCVQGAVSNYRLPEVVYNIANARDEAFTHSEAHIRAEDRLQWYLTSYINQDYGVYSQHEEIDWTETIPENDWPGWLTESQRWGVVWKHPTDTSNFFVKHPQGSGKRAGADRYGQVLQDEGTIVGVYNIPSSHPHPYLLGRIPTSYNDHMDNSSSGRIYLDYGVVKIALHMTKSFNWNNGDNSFRRDNAGKIGLVVEVVPGNNYASLAEFKAVVEPKLDDITWSASGNPRLTYNTLDGTQLDTKLHEYDKVDGETISYNSNSWKLLDNPWMHQDYNGDILTVTHQGEVRRYDFSNWTVNGDPNALQAEAATAGGGASIEATHNSYFGSGYGDFNRNGGFVEWRNVDGGPGGAAQLTFRYALQDGNRTGALLINGVPQDLTMTGTGAWTNYQTVTVTASLNAGTNNVIRLESTGQDFGNVDQLLVQAFGSVEVSTYLEAEDGTINAPMRVANDANASEGQYVWVPNGEGNGGGGYTELDFAVSVAGNYRILGRVIAPGTRDNSFYVSLDGGPDDTWSIPGSPVSWVWDEINNYTLGAGTHTIRVKQREDGTKLDQLWITSEAGNPSNARSITKNSKHNEVPVLTTDSEFRTYPNPAGEQLTITAAGQEDYQITIYDLTGRLMLQRNQLSGVATLDVSGLKSGVYLLKLRNSLQSEQRQRILIE